MVEIGIGVAAFNVIRFILVDLITSVIVEPAWELLVGSSAKVKVLRGEVVELRTFWNWRSWPCELSCGRRSRATAIVASVLFIGANLLGEFASDVTVKNIPGKEFANAYIGLGGKTSGKEDFHKILARITKSVDECVLIEGRSRMIVQVLYDHGGCVPANVTEPVVITPPCVMTKTQAKTNSCVYNTISEELEMQQINTAEGKHETSFFKAFMGSDAKVYGCPYEGECKLIRSRDSGTDKHLYCIDVEGSTVGSKTCLLMSAEWWGVTKMYGLEPNGSRVLVDVGEVPVVAGRTPRGVSPLRAVDEMAVRALSFFNNSFDQGVTYESFEISRDREAQVIALAMLGFLRDDRIKEVRNVSSDSVSTVVQFNLATGLLVPTYAVLVLVAACVAKARARSAERSGLKTKIGRQEGPRSVNKTVITVPTNLSKAYKHLVAREKRCDACAHGSGSGSVHMGLVDVSSGTQYFSMSTKESVRWNPEAEMQG